MKLADRSYNRCSDVTGLGMPASWLDDLNTAQREAATFGDGPLLVIAGAGTGKTKTLAARVANLIERGVAPDRILLLTFTRRAAAEMIARAGHLTGQTTAGRVWGGTFHSVANRLLRHYGRAIQLAPDFTVMDQGDAADLMNLIRNELGVARNDRRFPRKETLVAIYSRTVSAETKLKDVLKRHFPWCEDDFEDIRVIFQAYTQRKREQNVLDYDDLLLYWNALLNASGTGEVVAERFEHVLVDEYQDTNAVQARILQGLRRTNRNIMVVGDDAQSIYSFRAATVRNILDFPKQFPGAHVVTLEQNYRSTQPILAASNAVMADARQRYTKNLWSTRESEQRPILVTCVDEAEQSIAVARRIVSHLEEGIPLIRQAVLFRVGYHSDQLEVELARRNIPFHKYGGLKFIESAHIKDMLAFLRILENPYDEISWFRVLLLLDGIGPAGARRIVAALGVRAAERTVESGRSAGLSPLRRLLDHPPAIPSAARKPFESLRETLRACLGAAEPEAPARPSRKKRTTRKDARPRLDAAAAVGDPGDGASPALPGPAEIPLVSQIERIRHFYDPIFRNRYDNAAMRSRDLEQLEQIAAGYPTRGRFISDLTLDPPTSTSDLAQPPFLEEDYLTLSTIHSAKGCEWDVVYIIHAADGAIPSDMAVSDQDGVDEERRLFYVAMTRAKDRLYIYFPLRYYRTRSMMGDLHHYAQLTRFITPPVRKLLAEELPDVPREEWMGADDNGPAAAANVERRLNDLWSD